MKATGIVRRVDDLGRVVIPKEIRQQMKIREGDPLEVYLSDDGAVCFKLFQEEPLSNEEILNRFEEMSREEKTELIKKMIENF